MFFEVKFKGDLCYLGEIRYYQQLVNLILGKFIKLVRECRRKDQKKRLLYFDILYISQEIFWLK